MQTVNFQCGHCGKLMAVGTEFLGQQVRCPHCNQVVIAPSTNGAAPSAPAPASDPFGNLTEHEDIFSPKSASDDALFDQPDLPKLDFPRNEPLPPTVNYPDPFGSNLTPIESPPPVPPETSNQSPRTFPTFSNELPVSPIFKQETQTAELPARPDETAAYTPPMESPSLAAARSKRNTGMGGIIFLLLVYLPTLIWAIGASVLCYALWQQQQALQGGGSTKSGFDKMIDDSENPNFRKGGKVKRVNKLNFDKAGATRPLPPHLLVKLGKTIRVGDLEVTPQTVSRKSVSVAVEGFKTAEPCRFDPLVLELMFKNVSAEYAFAPLDNYFDRQYKGIGPVPLTLLQAGSQTFYGGPAVWVPAERRQRQWLVGRKNSDDVALEPGEEVESFVCTDGHADEQMIKYLFGDEGVKPYQGELLWRVQVRRGPIEYRGRMLSATAVIGVQFKSDDYLKNAAEQ